MKRIDCIVGVTIAMFLCVALAFCQEGRQNVLTATTNQAGEYTLDTGAKGTVTMNGKPLAGAVVTFLANDSVGESGYKTPEGGYTHLVLFAGKGSFEPRTPQGLLGKLNLLLPKTNITTGYFRTWVDNNRLIGGICTDDIAGLRKVIELILDLELISEAPLNEQSFKQHADKEQESLPEAEWRAMKDVEKDAQPIPNGLLQSIQEKRRAIQSAEYSVRWMTQDENETTIHKTAFRFQGKNQWFADVSEIMQSKTFQTGCDGKTEWSFINSRDIHYTTRNLTDIKEIDLSFLDPFGFLDESSESLEEMIKKYGIRYFGEEKVEGKKRHLFGYTFQQNDEGDKETTRIEIALDTETLLPAATRIQSEFSFDLGDKTISDSMRMILIYDIVSTNKELPDSAFLPSKTEGIEPTLKEKPDEGYDRFFVRIDDGSGGHMSVRSNGQLGQRGMSSSGLN